MVNVTGEEMGFDQQHLDAWLQAPMLLRGPPAILHNFISVKADAMRFHVSAPQPPAVRRRAVCRGSLLTTSAWIYETFVVRFGLRLYVNRLVNSIRVRVVQKISWH